MNGLVNNVLLINLLFFNYDIKILSENFPSFHVYSAKDEFLCFVSMEYFLLNPRSEVDSVVYH